jgi:hypothetical protein
MNMKDIFQLLAALAISLGGTTVVVVALAKWFGGFISTRLLDSYNNKHERELEKIKSNYSTELEKTKSELEKAKSRFLRYSEKQFELYNDLWKVLLQTKHQADMLWEKANPQQLPAFGEQIRLTRKAIDDNMILIEEDHYEKLIQLISQFENFQFGKLRLIEVSAQVPGNTPNNEPSEQEMRRAITKNSKIKSSYESLILEIGKSFRDQIRG